MLLNALLLRCYGLKYSKAISGSISSEKQSCQPQISRPDIFLHFTIFHHPLPSDKAANLTLLMSCVWNPIYPFQTSSNAQMKGQMCIEYPPNMWPWNEKFIFCKINLVSIFRSNALRGWKPKFGVATVGKRGLRLLDPLENQERYHRSAGVKTKNFFWWKMGN